MLTNNEDYVLRIELEDFEGNKRYQVILKYSLTSTKLEITVMHKFIAFNPSTQSFFFRIIDTHNIHTSRFILKQNITNLKLMDTKETLEIHLMIHGTAATTVPSQLTTGKVSFRN